MNYELVFCWAQVRRDFINAAVVQDESMQRLWVRFEQLFHPNKQRLKEGDPALPRSQQSEFFGHHQSRLEDLLKHFFERDEAQLKKTQSEFASAQLG